MAGRLWKLAVAFVISALLTWREWVEHHPPEIVLVAVLHFAVVWIALLLIVQIARWLGRKRRHKNS